MKKEFGLLPFIYTYKIVSFVFKNIVLFVKYISIGFFFFNIIALSLIVNGVSRLIKLVSLGFLWLSYFIYFIFVKNLVTIILYVIKGIIIICYFIYRFIKWIILGLLFPFVILYEIISLVFSKIRTIIHKFKATYERNKIGQINKKKRLQEERVYK